MKKNILVITTAVLSALILSGCASAPKNIMELSPVAIVSVTSNASLILEKEQNEFTSEADIKPTTGILGSLANKMFGSNDPEYLSVQERVDYASSALRKKFQDAGVEVIPSEKVKESKSLDSYMSFIYNTTDTVCSSDTRIVTSDGRRRNRDVAKEFNAKALVFVDMYFKKVRVGVGTSERGMGIRIYMTVTVIDENGDRCIYYEDIIDSDTSIPYDFLTRKYDKQALVNLAPGTIDKAYNRLFSKYFIMAEQPEAPEPEPVEISEEQRAQAVTIKLPAKKPEEKTEAESEKAAENNAEAVTPEDKAADTETEVNSSEEAAEVSEQMEVQSAE